VSRAETGQRAFGWLASRLILAYGLVMAIVLTFGDAYVDRLIPLYRLPVEWLLPEFRIESLGLARVNNEPVIALKLVLEETLWIGAKPVPPGGDLSASTLRGHALQHPILLYTLLLAWPGLFGPAGVARLSISIPLLLLVELLDVPLVLVGSVQDLLLATLAPGRLGHDPWIGWMDFLNGGGRLALALMAAALSLAGGQAVAQRWAPPTLRNARAEP
jgi:hypothetical protein